MLKTLSPLDFVPDPASAQPIYAQLASTLTRAIRAGRLAVGTRLPSERTLAQSLGVSRTTVTSAYQELMAAGLRRGHGGRGITVIADDPDETAGALSWPTLASRASRVARPRTMASGPGLIPFADGWLHPSLVPHATLAACAASALRQPATLTTTAPLLGLPALREAIARHLGDAGGLRATAADILVTGGAQQGLQVVADALLSPGDAVVCESPTWHGAFRAFRAAGAEVTGVATDRDGIDPDALEATLQRLRPKFVYLISSFQCPTGRQTSLERRRRLLEICARLRTPIVESHVYGEMAFGAALPSLKSLDPHGLVIQQGSLSKTVTGALRLGWLVAPPGAMALLAPAKATLDLSTPHLTQAVLAEFLAGGHYPAHLRAFRKAMQARRDAMVQALGTHCPQLRFAIPQGGMYLWARLPETLEAADVETAAAAAGVSVRNGDVFLPDGGATKHIRLCYAAPALADIEGGARRLGEALRALAQRQLPLAAQGPAFASV